jgi:putative DNA methylase
MGREIVSRRNLPHWYMPGAAHFITYRLFGTLPREVLDELKAMREEMLKQKPPAGYSPAEYRMRLNKQLFAAYDAALDRGGSVQYLADPRVAALVRSNLYHHDGVKYDLMAYCVMSNHVHVLLVPRDAQASRLPHVEQAARLLEMPLGEQSDERSPLTEIMHSLKSYTAHEANKLLRRSGPFWQTESYDHWIRDEDELERVVDYICANPLKAGIVQRPQDWFFCSCHDRFLRDGEVTAWLRK